MVTANNNNHALKDTNWQMKLKIHCNYLEIWFPIWMKNVLEDEEWKKLLCFAYQMHSSKMNAESMAVEATGPTS